MYVFIVAQSLKNCFKRTSTGMLLSVSFLVPTIAVHLLLKELRENLKNKILICYLLSLTVGYLIISLINITQARFDFVSCSIIGNYNKLRGKCVGKCVYVFISRLYRLLLPHGSLCLDQRFVF